MKTSISIALIIIAAIFSFVSGFSIGSHSEQAISYQMVSQTNSGSVATANAAESTPIAPAAGYGAPAVDAAQENTAASPGYGAPSPGYGQ
jgi:hypothetical protein